MPQSNEGILLLIGALFLLLGLLGGGFEISAIKIPPVGKFTRGFAFAIGAIVFGMGLFRLLLPTPIVITPTTPPPTAIPTAMPPSPVPPTQVSAPTQPASTALPETTMLPLGATIQDVTVDYDVTRFEKKGLLIHVKFNVSGMKNKVGRATAYFNYQDGSPLKDRNGAFATTNGNVAVDQPFTPGYDVTQYDNLELFLPYDELELDSGAYNLKFHVEIWESAHPENPALAVSPDIDFNFTK